MLVLLVSEGAVVVDDAVPAEDGSPPEHLVFSGPLVVVADRKYPGPDVVYRLTGRVDLDPLNQVPAGIALPLSHDAAPFTAWLQSMAALPVYLQMSEQAARAWREATVTGHPVAHVPGPRPHLQLAPPVEQRADERRDVVDGGDPFCLWCSRDDKPSPHAHESDDHPDEPVDRREKPPVRSVASILLAEAARCRAEATEAATHDPEKARELLEAAVGYERATGLPSTSLQRMLAESVTRDAIAPTS